MKVVIVGGVAGGATAAARIRRLDERSEIVVFERSGFISYANCGLPYYIGGVIEDPEDLTLQTPESFWQRFRIHMKVHHEVTAIHPDRKTVSVKNLESGEEFEENYDKLLLSPGAKPLWPKLPGMESRKLFTLRTVEDTFRIKEFVNQNKPKSAVMVGGGFIGLEVAENLRHLGLDVTIVQRPKQLMNPFDADMASFIHAEMRKHGVKLALGYSVEGFAERDGGVDVLLKDSEMFERIRKADVINKSTIARLYQISEEDVISIVYFPNAKAIKATIVRPLPSGALGERDVYGAQQHAPLMLLPVDDAICG